MVVFQNGQKKETKEYGDMIILNIRVSGEN